MYFHHFQLSSHLNGQTAKPNVWLVKRLGHGQNGESYRRRRGGGGWSNRESNNDGSDQSTTCQTLEVISCFIEDFYGILAAHPTSEWGRRGGEREFSPSPSPHPPTHTPAPFLLWTTPLPEPYGSRWNRVALPQSVSNNILSHLLAQFLSVVQDCVIALWQPVSRMWGWPWSTNTEPLNNTGDSAAGTCLSFQEAHQALQIHTR